MSVLDPTTSRVTSSIADRELEPLSNLYVTSLSTKYSNLNVSIESLESVCNEQETSSQGLPRAIAQFNLKLKCYGGYNNIFVLASISQITALLDLYYNSKSNPVATNLFPYLHGLYNDRQRIFFNEKFRNTHNDNFDLDEFKDLNTVSIPTVSNFNLMTVHTNSRDVSPKLINSVTLDDLFDFSRVLSTTSSSDLNNRNYKLQVKLMAHLSHFLIYDNNCNFIKNLKVAMSLSQVIGPDKFVYVLNFNKDNWLYIPVDYVLDYNYRYLDNLPVSSINNEKFSCKLLKWEQNLLWKNNSMKWFTKNVCLGNLIDYNSILNNPNDFDFKLVVNCTDVAGISRVGEELPDQIDFPSSGTFNFGSLSLDDILSFANLLKQIHKIIARGERIFIFSFDGFTGLSLLTLAVGMMLTNLSLEKLILNVYSDDDSIIENNLKLYFFVSDLQFLKKFEGVIKWIKEYELQDNKLITSLNCSLITQTPVSLEKLDWFDLTLDNNFPCRIYKNLSLGSLNHANSVTVLNCLKIERVLSIGERPSWLRLNKFNETNTKPIYAFKNTQDDEILVFEIRIDLPQMPHLKTLVFVQNSKDDGKESLIPLLIESPPHIQQKLLVDPEEPIKTLVHCKIGVSRSATISIATLMRHQKLSLIESYMLVRINRFNIIIQPNLRLFYDLYYYEDYLNRQRGDTRRRHTWWNLCDEIHKLNSHYISE